MRFLLFFFLQLFIYSVCEQKRPAFFTGPDGDRTPQGRKFSFCFGVREQWPIHPGYLLLYRALHYTTQFNIPGDSKWPFDLLVGGHLTPWKGHLTIPKRSQRITWDGLFHKPWIKGSIINQSVFHGSCHWWVLFPQSSRCQGFASKRRNALVVGSAETTRLRRRSSIFRYIDLLQFENGRFLEVGGLEEIEVLKWILSFFFVKVTRN